MKVYITVILFFLTGVVSFSQEEVNKPVFLIKGSVKERETLEPISGVNVYTDSGFSTTTNNIGEFEIRASRGDELTIQSFEFETVIYTIQSDEDIEVLVSDAKYPSKGSSFKRERNSIQKHQFYLDSANFYKEKNIAKSIDFVAKSISQLGSRGNKKELAKSLSTLGEIYLYDKQYDLAIANFKEAQESYKSSLTALMLGKAYIFNKEYSEAEKVLTPLTKITKMVPFRKVELYETLGDAYKEMSLIDKAVVFYNEGLKIAQKNQISSKMTDLNSKIADTYASENRLVEADGFYQNSLKLSRNQAPQRVIIEEEKVADFYNKQSLYDDEIKLRKKTLKELKSLPEPVAKKVVGVKSNDSVTTQRINYKIANAYISQNKYEEAIPFLERSIVEADKDDDLVVQKDATRKLSEVYNFKGDYSKALKSYQDYVALVDTLYIRKEQEISRAARYNREIASKQSRITGLEQERELSQSKYDLAVTEQELVIESNKRQKWIIYTLVFGMVLTALTAFFYFRSSKQQKLANNLLALKSLRSQMNPHFIFNALNSVNNFIAKSDERSANRYLTEFSTLMRSVLENSEEDFIPLTKELELLSLYVKLEHSRFPDKFDYKINVDERIDVAAFQIPPMLLQPYIENAIWHGLRYKKEKGFLQIDLDYKNNHEISIVITDNGIGRKKSAALKTQNQKQQKSKGMGNIKKRVAILNDMYKNKLDVYITDLENNGTGTKVQFTLKKDA